MYAIKKIIGALLGPLVIAFMLLALAVCLRAWGRRRAALWAAATACLIAYLGAAPFFGATLLGTLERQYPPMAVPPDVEYIAVLGSDYSPGKSIAITGALDADGLARIVEGIRLSKASNNARLIVSGGAPEGGRSAHGYARLARELGVPQSSLIVIDEPLDTAAEARAVANILKTTPFVLVTSAYHMPRAMRLMKAAGTQPIAASAGQRVKDVGWRWQTLLPSSGGLRMTELALHEYAGLVLIAVAS